MTIMEIGIRSDLSHNYIKMGRQQGFQSPDVGNPIRYGTNMRMKQLTQHSVIGL